MVSFNPQAIPMMEVAYLASEATKSQIDIKTGKKLHK